jgi:hypothetical protein
MISIFVKASNQGIKEHPERMPQLRDVNATLDENGGARTEQPEVKKLAKKAKWHLGIRSQSKPQDIMNEVFKAMKANNMVNINLFCLNDFKYQNIIIITKTKAMEILQSKHIQPESEETTRTEQLR